jgi:hypothetical protein
MEVILNPRSEDEVFAELQALASEPGYAHAIAALCFRDNAIGFTNKLNANDLAKMYSPDRLIRTEIATLIGLLVKNDLNLTIPHPEQMQNMLDRSDKLLRELHTAMLAPSSKVISKAILQKESANPFTRGDVLREAIFYCGESAYDFQFRDFAISKYAADDDWLKTNKGFSTSDAVAVAQSISTILKEAIFPTLDSLRYKDPRKWTVLPVYTFRIDQVIDATQLSLQVVSNILDSFSLPVAERNKSFNSVSDFNCVSAYPILRISPTEYVLFQSYSLFEAIYESPFYWMNQDKNYIASAEKNRGAFTEHFCADRLRAIYGERRVYENVVLTKGKKTIAEIDILVLFGNRAVIVQAKSKRLTVESRKGNDNQLKNDFKLAIQNSYKQGLSCAKAIQENDIIALDNQSQVIKIHHPLKEVYIFCVLSEHYPALSFQAQQLLNVEQTEQIKFPFVMDIFLLDTMVEMLPSPLYFISYINRRTEYNDKVLAGHEMTVLSYHLKHNLWIEPEFGFFLLDDDICADLDIAMMVRRNGLRGKATPDGILTRIRNTNVGQIIKQIENADNSALVDLGFFLLALSEDTILDLSKGIKTIVARAVADFSNHDVTIGVNNGETGITVHCNYEPIETALESLNNHCERRKYSQKAQTWFGLCLEPRTGAIRFNLNLDFPWKQSSEMDNVVANLPKGQKKINLLASTKPRKKKAGRNDPCPCGSGRKYKKCCLYRIN